MKRLKLYLSALLVMQVLICIGFRSSIRTGSIDFRTYYAAGYMLRTGDSSQLYDYPTEERVQDAIVAPAPAALPFFAPPVTALLFVPFSYAPYRSALLVFGVVSLAFLALAVVVMRPYLRALSTRWPPLPALLFLTFLPVGFTLVMGQLSILILLIDCAAFVLLEADSPFLAGLVLSLGLMKFQTTIPVAVLFLLWRRWRFSLGFLSGGAVLLAISTSIAAVRGLTSYVRSVEQISALAGTPLQRAVGLAPRTMANLYGLVFMLTPNNHTATIVTLIASLVLILWAARQRPSFPLALLVATLVSFHFYPCDLTLLLLPIALLCNHIFSENTPPPTSEAASGWPTYRRQILFCSLGAFLASPVMVEIISNNAIFLYALPILGLTLCPLDWQSLKLPAAPETHLSAAIQPSAA